MGLAAEVDARGFVNAAILVAAVVDPGIEPSGGQVTIRDVLPVAATILQPIIGEDVELPASAFFWATEELFRAGHLVDAVDQTAAEHEMNVGIARLVVQGEFIGVPLTRHDVHKLTCCGELLFARQLNRQSKFKLVVEVAVCPLTSVVRQPKYSRIVGGPRGQRIRRAVRCLRSDDFCRV